MDITISGKFSYEVFTEAQSIVIKLRDCLEGMDFSDVDTKLSGIVYFPVIMSDKFPVPKKNLRSYSIKEKAEFVNVEIPYDQWLHGDAHSRLLLIISGLQKAIIETKDSKLSTVSKSLIMDKIADVIDNCD
jgi:hypothetical protein